MGSINHPMDRESDKLLKKAKQEYEKNIGMKIHHEAFCKRFLLPKIKEIKLSDGEVNVNGRKFKRK
ncbi:hypothetical protein C0585_00995 [Candidatus Woesearchaeota archaeon]|uniref:hypothetical protein n=1 Tax=uncultured Arcobacter sp. TaxID=165434 RepID=UPI000CB3168D|nr:hypothetical protein [uncultured Arcobacter sp.]PLW80760.1 MAG: hypothetical protein C0585_00995 [Candidatus Woesearchaeota archaeon]